jgi:uncharacterized membrane protein YfcA
MDYLIIAAVSLTASGLTLFSGFGLGTLLLPVFALFFPVELAVAATALVHGANNLFKVTAVGRHADRDLILRFGLPAILAAFAGAALLGYLSHLGELFIYTLGNRTAMVTPMKLLMGALMLFFALFELVPRLRQLRFHRRHLVVGGLLSGFFGGLSGHQGALRSAFLTKTGISPQGFVGTNAWIGFMVDAVRIATYASLFLTAKSGATVDPALWPLIGTGCLAAFAGVLLGKRYLHTITMQTIHRVTGCMLVVIALALAAGII